MARAILRILAVASAIGALVWLRITSGYAGSITGLAIAAGLLALSTADDWQAIGDRVWLWRVRRK